MILHRAWAMALAALAVVPVGAAEDPCAMIEALPLPQGLQKMGFERAGDDRCTITYQSSQPADALHQSLLQKLERAGWQVVSDNLSSMGFVGGFKLEAARESWGLAAELAQVMMFQQLKVTMRPLSERERLDLAKLPSAKALLRKLEAIPRPEGVRRMGMELRPIPEASLRYAYAGDLKAAFAWVAQRLQAQGWRIERQKWNAMAGLAGGEIAAVKGDLHLQARFSTMPMAMGAMIEYRLRKH